MLRRAVHEWLAPLLAYAGVAVIWVADVLRSPSTLLHGHFDAYNYAWRIWWVAGGHRAWDAPLLRADGMYYPVGHDLAASELAPLQVVPAALLSKLLGVVLAYNVVVYANFVLAALLMYAFCRAVGLTRGAAFLGGLVYGFAAYPTAHALGHLPLMGNWVLPFGLIWVERLVRAEDRRAKLIAGALVGVAVGLATWSAWYYTVIFGLALLVYGLFRARGAEWRTLLPPVGVAAGVAAVMVLPLYALVQSAGGSERMTWPFAAYAGASPLSFLLPSTVQTVFGPSFVTWWMPRSVEDSLHVGWVPIVLAGVALLAAAANGLAPTRRALLATGAVFLLLSLGPFLYLYGAYAWEVPRALLIDVSVFGRNLGEVMAEHGLPLPPAVLMFAPVFRSMREFTRYGIVVLAVVAALAAIGFDAAAKSLKPAARAAVLALLAVLVVAEFFPRSMASPAAPTDADRLIASRDGGGAVVYLPETQMHNDEQMLHTAWTGKPLAMGDTTFLPPGYRGETAVMERYPDKAALDVMRERKVRWIVWNTAEGGPAPEAPGVFEEAADFGDEVVLELVGTPPDTPVGRPDIR